MTSGVITLTTVMTSPFLTPAARKAVDGVHLTGKRAGEMATAAGAGRLLLTHIPVWNDPLVTAQEARTTYDGQLAVAVSGVTYTV